MLDFNDIFFIVYTKISIMANLTASKKDIIKTKKNRQENIPILSRARTEVKKFLKMLEISPEMTSEITKQLSSVNSVCAKAAKKGIYHINKTSRIVSRLTHKMKKKFNLYS